MWLLPLGWWRIVVACRVVERYRLLATGCTYDWAHDCCELRYYFTAFMHVIPLHSIHAFCMIIQHSCILYFCTRFLRTVLASARCLVYTLVAEEVFGIRTLRWLQRMYLELNIALGAADVSGVAHRAGYSGCIMC